MILPEPALPGARSAAPRPTAPGERNAPPPGPGGDFTAVLAGSEDACPRPAAPDAAQRARRCEPSVPTPERASDPALEDAAEATPSDLPELVAPAAPALPLAAATPAAPPALATGAALTAGPGLSSLPTPAPSATPGPTAAADPVQTAGTTPAPQPAPPPSVASGPLSALVTTDAVQAAGAAPAQHPAPPSVASSPLPAATIEARPPTGEDHAPLPAEPAEVPPVARSAAPDTPLALGTIVAAERGVDAAPPAWQLALEPLAAPHRADAGLAPPGTATATAQAQHVVAQIAVAVTGAAEPKLEIRLDPPELGQVEIHLTETEAGVTAIVMAQRPETHDLLRRHAELLAQELGAAGFTNVELAFAAGQDPGTAGSERPPTSFAAAVTSAAAGPEPAPMAARAAIVDGGLDIRI